MNQARYSRSIKSMQRNMNTPVESTDSLLQLMSPTCVSDNWMMQDSIPKVDDTATSWDPLPLNEPSLVVGKSREMMIPGGFITPRWNETYISSNTTFTPSFSHRSASLCQILEDSLALFEDEDDSEVTTKSLPISATVKASALRFLETIPIFHEDGEVPPAADLLMDDSIRALLSPTSTSDVLLHAPQESSRSSTKKRPCYPTLHDSDFLCARTGKAPKKAKLERQRPFQDNQWSERFQELQAFQRQHGHCLVPYTYRENLPLARWVKRQRYQYKLFQDRQGSDPRCSTMTPERISALEAIGFVWDSQASQWAERYQELQRFVELHGHANVPSSYQASPALATWVKCQRRNYKLFQAGLPSHITLDRIEQLEAVKFQWELRPCYSSKKKH